MSKDEAYEIIDFSFQLSDKLPETYDQLKSEIKSYICLLYTSPSPRDATTSRMPSSA